MKVFDSLTGSDYTEKKEGTSMHMMNITAAKAHFSEVVRQGRYYYRTYGQTHSAHRAL